MSGCMAATAVCGVWQAMVACRMWQLWRHAGAGCLTVGAVAHARRPSNKDARLEGVPSFIHATCSMVWSAGWGECERCAQPLRCTRHATRGSLEVTMLGGMGGQRFTNRNYHGREVNSSFKLKEVELVCTDLIN